MNKLLVACALITVVSVNAMDKQNGGYATCYFGEEALTESYFTGEPVPVSAEDSNFLSSSNYSTPEVKKQIRDWEQDHSIVCFSKSTNPVEVEVQEDDSLVMRQINADPELKRLHEELQRDNLSPQ